MAPGRSDLRDKQARRFAETGCLKVRLIAGEDPGKIESLCRELLSSRSSAVHVGDFGETWREHYLPAGGEIADLLASHEARVWTQAVSGETLSADPPLWGNVYRPGEHITWHCDSRGQVQLLICLRQPPPDCGGVFQVKRSGETHRIRLAPGDGLLFRATKIEHRITPLRATADTPEPIRITAVARYFSPPPPRGL